MILSPRTKTGIGTSQNAVMAVTTCTLGVTLKEAIGAVAHWTRTLCTAVSSVVQGFDFRPESKPT
jgi:hypothetical protein